MMHRPVEHDCMILKEGPWLRGWSGTPMMLGNGKLGVRLQIPRIAEGSEGSEWENELR